MKKRFLEGFRKFVAIFVLVQMVLVLFPAPAVYASSESQEGIRVCRISANVDGQYESHNLSDLSSVLPDDIVDTDESSEHFNPINQKIWENNCINTKPTISLSYDNKSLDNGDVITIERGNSFNGIVATVDDEEEEDITNQISVNFSPEVNTSVLGDYLVRYNVKDSKGLAADEVVITVMVVENPSPEISFIYPTPDSTSTVPSDGFRVRIQTDPDVKSCKITLEKKVESDSEPIYDSVDMGPLDGTKDSADPIYHRAFEGLSDGDYSFFVVCSDVVNSEESDKRLVTIDTTGPEINFKDLTPEDGARTKAVSFLIEVDASSDAVSCDISIGEIKDKQMDPKHYSSGFEYEVGLLKEGVYEYTVRCYDEHGNKSIIHRDIIIDRSVSFDFTSPTPGTNTVISNDSFKVRVEAKKDEDLTACSIWLNGIDYDMISGPGTEQWEMNFTSLSEGNYSFLVRCLDKAGNEDITPPRFLIVDFVNEPVVLTPVSSLVVSDFYAPVTEKDETAISSAIEKIEEDVLGEEGAVAETQAGNWWWIVALILVALLFANFHLAKRFSEMDIAKKILMVTPMVFGLVALVIHQSLIRGTEYSPWQDDIWLLIAVMVLAYYLFKGYTEKKEEKPKPSITKNSKNKKGKK